MGFKAIDITIIVESIIEPIMDVSFAIRSTVCISQAIKEQLMECKQSIVILILVLTRFEKFREVCLHLGDIGIVGIAIEE